MDVLGKLKAQGLEQLNMEGQGGQPLVSPDHVGGAHQVVVHGVGKVIGGDAVGLQQHVVHVVFGDGQLALYQVVKLELVLDGAGGAEPQHPGVTGGKLGADVLHGPVPPDGVITVVAGGLFIGLLLFPHGGELLLGAEAGVGLALRYQFLGEHMVDARPLPLAVGAVSPKVPIDGGTLVKVDVVVLQGVDEHLYRSGDLPLGIGILHPEEENAAGLVGHPLGDHALDQVAQVDKACGGGGHPGHHGPFRQVSLGEALLQLLGGGGHIGKQQLGQCFIIHKILTSLSSISRLEYSISDYRNQGKTLA